MVGRPRLDSDAGDSRVKSKSAAHWRNRGRLNENLNWREVQMGASPSKRSPPRLASGLASAART